MAFCRKVCPSAAEPVFRPIECLRMGRFALPGSVRLADWVCPPSGGLSLSQRIVAAEWRGSLSERLPLCRRAGLPADRAPAHGPVVLGRLLSASPPPPAAGRSVRSNRNHSFFRKTEVVAAEPTLPLIRWACYRASATTYVLPPMKIMSSGPASSRARATAAGTSSAVSPESP